MSTTSADMPFMPYIESQFNDVRGLTEGARDALIVCAIRVEGKWVVRSRYGDDSWQFVDLPSNIQPSHGRLDFHRVPPTFRAVMKAIMYRYMHRGREGQLKPKGGTLGNFFDSAIPFLRYLDSLKVAHLRAINPIIFLNYVSECKAIVLRSGKTPSKSHLLLRFRAVEAIYELSQYTPDPVPAPPWPGSSSKFLAGLTGSDSCVNGGNKTPLIPDAIFCTLFEKAYQHVQHGKALLDLRDEIDTIGSTCKRNAPYNSIIYRKNCRLAALGWKEGLEVFNKTLLDLRTACYIVLASTTGCRNHELANVNAGSLHRTEDDDGTIFHWMRSRSEKTNIGIHDWMIPESAVRALRVMERWAEPYQKTIAKEIATRRQINLHDPEIARAQKHLHALFLGIKGHQARTLSLTAWNRYIKTYAKDVGQNWHLTTHQFRRKFANYVAHSRFGDLRYLRKHFAHWSMDMMLGYAMDESWGRHLDLELYDEIQAEFDNIKLVTVETWLDDVSLAGGYGRSLKQWQRDPTNLAIFKNQQTMISSISESTAIRSNGHAWCTADNNHCIGNTFEKTRCSDCNNAVIDSSHLGIYRQLYNNLKDLLDSKDIGENGRVRVLRDIKRYRDVLIQLGYDPERGRT